MPDDVSFRTEAEAGAAAQNSSESGKSWLARRSMTERGLLIAGALALVALVVGAGNWWTHGRFVQTTDNAYVRADISVISARVGGYVHSVDVADNQVVAAGDPLLHLEAADYEAAVAQARANLSRAEAEYASIGAQRALASSDVARYRPLARRGILSPAGMQEIEARAAQMGGTAAASRAAIEASRAALATAELNLERTIVRAPIGGVVGDRAVRVGQQVQPGAPLMAVVPMQSLYVVANFKETQLEHIRPGQRVTIRPDVAHGRMSLTGVVDSLAPASGSEFSIIPMDTATGNFTKIVQRVPVRVRLDEESARAAAGVLRPGLSATVSVDTRE